MVIRLVVTSSYIGCISYRLIIEVIRTIIGIIRWLIYCTHSFSVSN